MKNKLRSFLLEFAYKSVYRNYEPTVLAVPTHSMSRLNAWRMQRYIYTGARWWYSWAKWHMQFSSTNARIRSVNIYTYEEDIVHVLEHLSQKKPMDARLYRVFVFTFLVGRFNWFGRLVMSPADAEMYPTELLGHYVDTED